MATSQNRSERPHRSSVPRTQQGAFVAEPFRSLEATLRVDLTARPTECFRRLAEHGACLLVIALGLAENPPSFPHGAAPQPTLPHSRDPLGFA